MGNGKETIENLGLEELVKLIKASRPGTASSSIAVNELIRRNNEAREQFVRVMNNRDNREIDRSYAVILAAIPEADRTPEVLAELLRITRLAKSPRK